MMTALFSVGGTIVVALIGLLGATLSRRTQREDTQVKSWSQLVEANQKERDRLEARLDKQDEKLAAQDTKIAAQDTKIGELSRQLDASRDLLTSAIGFIRHLLSFIAENLPDRPAPSVPLSIEEELRRLEQRSN
ncbi:hypothetical protein TPB0596_12650 [Tsukamurella pulmonis]|uniref:hypothetical protein n=1 Tax=Tsukamurella pulmonis TaxID=47312 RepID=UPI001EDF090C|nr:hypothetical protein [Tsukamurella pulmonis]BDD81502.1 hypothetical protein TPB0596_12650 [Tsukamurella pulmonis]